MVKISNGVKDDIKIPYFYEGFCLNLIDLVIYFNQQKEVSINGYSFHRSRYNKDNWATEQHRYVTDTNC